MEKDSSINADERDVEARAAPASIGLRAANTATALPSISSPRNSAPPPGGLRVSRPETRTWSVGSSRARMIACAGWTGLSGSNGGEGGAAAAAAAAACFSAGGGASGNAALGGFDSEVFLLLLGGAAGACWTGASSALIAFQSAETDAASATRSRGSTSAVARASRSVVESEGLATAASRINAGGGRGSDDIFFDSYGVPREFSALGFRDKEDEAVSVR